jgi:flagellar protein FliS
MTPTNPQKEYVANRVAAATPVELTRMLFEGAVQAVQEGVAADRAGDILARGNAVTKAVQILGELRFSLRRDVAPQYCDTLSGLYGYLQNRLIQAHAEKSESMLQEVLQLIQTLLEGWIGAMRNLSAMGNLSGMDSAAAAANDSPAAEPAVVEPAAPALSASLSPYSSENPYSSPYSSTTPAATEPQNRSWQF